VYNGVAEDYRLSHKARGVLLELLCKPPGWVISAEAIARCNKNGRELNKEGWAPPAGAEAIYSAFDELETWGYLHRIKYQDVLGRWVNEGTLYETPWTEAEHREYMEITVTPLPAPQNPSDSALSGLGERGVISKDTLVKNTPSGKIDKTEVDVEEKEENLPSIIASTEPGSERTPRTAIKENKQNTFIVAKEIMTNHWLPFKHSTSQPPAQVTQLIKHALDNGVTYEDAAIAINTVALAGQHVAQFRFDAALPGAEEREEEIKAAKRTAKGRLAADESWDTETTRTASTDDDDWDDADAKDPWANDKLDITAGIKGTTIVDDPWAKTA
jgi:hypothetical protein